MKKGLLLVVALLAMASLMAAMAFTSATVTSDAAFKVTNTNGALLALEAGDHAAAGYSGEHQSNSKKLVIDWAKGKDGASYGVQWGSVYNWEKLFKVTNNSEKAVQVSIKITKPADANIGSVISLRDNNGTTPGSWVTVAGRLTNGTADQYRTLTFSLVAGQSVWIDSRIDSTQGSISNGSRSLSLVVDAVEIAN